MFSLSHQLFTYADGLSVRVRHVTKIWPGGGELPQRLMEHVGMIEERIMLADGEAERMGEGCFVLMQETPEGVQSIVVQRSDLEALLAAC